LILGEQHYLFVMPALKAQNEYIWPPPGYVCAYKL